MFFKNSFRSPLSGRTEPRRLEKRSGFRAGDDSLLPLHGVLDLSVPLVEDDALDAFVPPGGNAATSLSSFRSTTLDDAGPAAPGPRFDAALLAEVGARPFLRELWLTNNPDLPRFPAALCAKLPALLVLGLANVGLRSLPAELGECARLRRLHADGNLLDALPVELAALQDLRVVTLGKNAFFKVPVASLPRAIAELSLADNAVELGPRDLEDLKRFKLLVRLDLAGNDLENAAAVKTALEAALPNVHVDLGLGGGARARPAAAAAAGEAAPPQPIDDELYAMLRRRAGRESPAAEPY